MTLRIVRLRPGRSLTRRKPGRGVKTVGTHSFCAASPMGMKFVLLWNNFPASQTKSMPTHTFARPFSTWLASATLIRHPNFEVPRSCLGLDHPGQIAASSHSRGPGGGHYADFHAGAGRKRSNSMRGRINPKVVAVMTRKASRCSRR